MNQEGKSDLRARPRFIAALSGVLACCSLLAQTSTAANREQTLRIHGTVTTAVHPGHNVQGAKVTFTGQNTKKATTTDERGFYEVDLSVGVYTMTVDPPDDDLQRYQRPLFRVASATNLILNVELAPQVFCEPGAPQPGHVPADYSPCREVDLFSVPSEDGIPFSVLIRCFARWKTDRGYVYGGVSNPVFVAYNLFTLRADHVTYDVQAKTLQATGHVVVANPDGTVQRAESMAFRIENGQASPLP